MAIVSPIAFPSLSVITDKDDKADGENQVRVAILVLLIVEGLMTMGGIDGYILTFTTFPICLIIAETVDIPRRFIPGMLVLNCAFMAAPGAPQISNVMAQSAMASAGVEANSNAYMIGGIVGSLIIAVGGYFTLVHMILRAKRNRETFELGRCQKPQLSGELPNVFVSLLPLLTVFFIYSILGQNIATALFAGIVINIVLMWKYIPHVENDKGKVSIPGTLKNLMNAGVGNYPNTFLTMLASCGFASVVTSTTTFESLISVMAEVNINIYILCFVMCAVIVALSASPPVAIMISIPAVLSVAQARGIAVNTDAIFRIAVFTSITFESLPWNGLVLVSNQLADTTHKEAYKPYFLQTVIYTTLAAFVCSVMAMLGI